MKRIIEHALFLGVAVVALAMASACGGGTASTARHDNQAPSASSSSGVDCSDPNLPMDEWTAHCSGNASPQSSMFAVGQPFSQSLDPSGTGIPGMEDPSSPTAIPLSVTVKAIRCGISSYPFTASSTSGDIQNDQPARASKGNQFCQATVTAKNVGQESIKDIEIYTLEQTTLTADGKTYAADPLSKAIAYELNSRLNNKGINTGEFIGEVVNPGVTATRELVWQIPASANVDSVDFTSPATTVKVH